MPRSSLVKLHALAGTAGLVTICVFWASALTAELFLSTAGIVAVRTTILYALPILILALVVTGGSGTKLAGRSKSPTVQVKLWRMKLAAANGILVLVPCAVYLSWRASAGALDTAFATVQVVELIAGATNIIFLRLNMRAGIALRSRRISAKSERTPA